MTGGDTQFKSITCPYCSAEYKVPKTVYYATCPYCGTTFKLDSPEEKIEHFLFKISYDESDAYRKAKSFAQLLVGAAKDLEFGASFKKAELYYLPIYIYEIRVEAYCEDLSDVDTSRGSKFISVGGGEDVKYYVVPAVENPPIPIPEDYLFPARMKEYFKPSILEKGMYLQPELNPMEYYEIYRSKSIGEAMEEAKISCPNSSISLKDESRYVGIHHYPFWDIIYQYRGGEYRAVVDGADGTIVYLEYPLDWSRGLPAALGLFLADISTGLLTWAASQIFQSYNPSISFLLGLISFAPGLTYGLTKLIGGKEIYRYRQSEEESFLPIR